MDKTVFIIDDDASVRDSLGLMLSLRGYRTTLFSSGPSFLGALADDWRGCLIIDIRMPMMSGLELQRELLQRNCTLPVIVITGHGDVASAREAFRAEAIDFLEKPLNEGRLLEAIEEAFACQDLRAAARSQKADFARRVEDLTPREREVMELVVAGQHNREIASQLGISPRTVEVHKARMMAKLDADNIPQLVRICLEANGNLRQ